MNRKRAEVKILEPKEADKPIAPFITGMLDAIGEDPNRDGLRQTPFRVEKAMRFLTSGYQTDIAKIVHKAIFGLTYE